MPAAETARKHDAPVRKPRVVLADDHTLVLEGLRRLLEPEFDLVGLADNGRALLEAVDRTCPDVAVLDISMPLLNGIETAREMKKTHPETGIVFVSMHAHRTYVEQAFRAGGAAYILKRSAASELVHAIREVLAGRYYVTPLVTKDVAEDVLAASAQSERRVAGLTGRQRQVLQLVAEGKSGKEIAYLLNISLKTVEFHKASIMRELDLHSVAELTRYALDHGIVGS